MGLMHILVMNENGKPYPSRECFCGIKRDSGVSFKFISAPVVSNNSGYYCYDCFDFYMEAKNMRDPEQAITDNDLHQLKDITGREMWDAMHASYPEISLNQRTNVINHLIKVRALGTPEKMTAEYFRRQELRPKNPVEFPSQNVRGVVTDVKKSAGMLYFSVDGNVVIVHPMAQVVVWPDTDVETDVLSDAAKALNSYTKSVEKTAFMQIKADGLCDMRREFKGRLVKTDKEPFTPGVSGGGVFTDARRIDPNFVELILGGNIWTFRNDFELWVELTD